MPFLEGERKGQRLRIVPAEPVDELSRIEGLDDDIRGDPVDLVHLDRSDEWRP